MSIKRSLPIHKRTCNSVKNNDNIVDDFLRALVPKTAKPSFETNLDSNSATRRVAALESPNRVIQNTKDDIIQDVRTIVKKELKKEMDDNDTITNYMIMLSFVSTNVNIFIATM